MLQSTDLQRLIVEFIHPGQEFRPRTRVSDHRVIWNDNGVSGVRCWNNEKEHKRKFLVSRGLSRDSADGKDVESLLIFWAEWEPQSRFRKLEQQTPCNTHTPLPDYVHRPFLVEGSTGKHNTDPFVFGPAFWFTNCQQKRRPFLTNLPRGSLVIFGTAYGRGEHFALDTVFVAGERFTPAQYRQ